MNKSKSFCSLCHSCQSSCSEIDKVSMGNLTDLNVSLRRSESCDNKFVNQNSYGGWVHCACACRAPLFLLCRTLVCSSCAG